MTRTPQTTITRAYLQKRRTPTRISARVPLSPLAKHDGSRSRTHTLFSPLARCEKFPLSFLEHALLQSSDVRVSFSRASALPREYENDGHGTNAAAAIRESERIIARCHGMYAAHSASLSNDLSRAISSRSWKLPLIRPSSNSRRESVVEI